MSEYVIKAYDQGFRNAIEAAAKACEGQLIHPDMDKDHCAEQDCGTYCCIDAIRALLPTDAAPAAGKEMQ